MENDIKRMNEIEAVKRLVEITGTEFVFKGHDFCSAAEMLQILRKNFDHERNYILDNGPRDTQPGVYRIDADGVIKPSRLYAPEETLSRGGMAGRSIEGGPSRIPSNIHVDFGD